MRPLVVTFPALKAAFFSKLSNMTKWYITYGGPDVTRLRKTGEILGLKLDGDVPPPIREFTMAKMKRAYPKINKEETHEYKPFECVVWDMVKFKYPSLGGANYSHDGVDRKTNLRFAYCVGDASAETFIEVLIQFIALIGSIPGEFVLRITRADQGSNYTSNAVRKFLNEKH